MIVVDDSKYTQAGPSNTQPPTFQESIEHDHVVLDFQLAGAPPAFAPYEAEFIRSKQGHIISHDPHLNEDGKQLLLFNNPCSTLTFNNEQEKLSTGSYYHKH